MPIAIRPTVLQAHIVINTAPAIIRALLIPLPTAVVARAEPSAFTRVDIAALVGNVADLVGAALAAARAAAGLVLDGCGGAAAVLMGQLVEGREERGEWKRTG